MQCTGHCIYMVYSILTLYDIHNGEIKLYSRVIATKYYLVDLRFLLKKTLNYKLFLTLLVLEMIWIPISVGYGFFVFKCVQGFSEQVCEWSAQWHSYIIVLGSILLQVPKKQNLRCGFLFKWVIMRVLNKERREERRREAIYSKAKEKGDNYGLHTSFNLICWDRTSGSWIIPRGVLPLLV